MALPSSPPITFSEVQTEFGGGSPGTNLRAYLKGGSYVSLGDSAPNVPESGTIKLTDFLGAYKATVGVTITPPYVGGVGPGEPAWVQSDTAEVSYYGFHAPSISIGWSKLSGDTIAYTTLYGGIQIYFREFMSIGEEKIAVYRCSISDALGNSAHADLGVDMVNN